jgi:hypothetical protein
LISLAASETTQESSAQINMHGISFVIAIIEQSGKRYPRIQPLMGVNEKRDWSNREKHFYSIMSNMFNCIPSMVNGHIGLEIENPSPNSFTNDITPEQIAVAKQVFSENSIVIAVIFSYYDGMCLNVCTREDPKLSIFEENIIKTTEETCKIISSGKSSWIQYDFHGKQRLRFSIQF